MSDAPRPHLPGPLVAGPNPTENRSKRRMGFARRVLFAVGAPIAVSVVRFMWATYRFEVHGEKRIRDLIAEQAPMVLTFWHDGLFVLTWYLSRLSAMGVRVTYLVSPSIDGEFGVRMLSVIGGRAVRGSATRSGVKAVRGLYRATVRDNASPVVAPDGPRGPRHHCKPGAVMLAQLAGVHVLPMACAVRRRWRLRTWDRLQVPFPFTRVAIELGDPYTVSSDRDVELEAHRAELERVLEDLVARAEERVGRGERAST